MSGIIGAAAGLLGGGGLSIPLLLIGKLLGGGTDWKAVAAEQGVELANQQIKKLWKSHLRGKANDIATDMESEGWSWENAGNVEFLKKQKVDEKTLELLPTLGPGFFIVRDMMYSQLRESKLPGGAVRDSFRDNADDKVWAEIKGLVTPDMSLVTIAEITGDALVEQIN